LIDLTGVQLLLNNVEAGLCCIFRTSRSLHGAGIRLQSAQGVRDILECGNHGGAILSFGLIERRTRDRRNKPAPGFPYTRLTSASPPGDRLLFANLTRFMASSDFSLN
jgi:hypothetical protein